MNIPIETNTNGLNDLFFRTADRMRIEGCVNAVANEGLSLALSCAHEALLDHYVQQLLQRLNQAAPGHSIEVYFPANTDSLISRFNEILASQSVREATRNSGEPSPAQIWLVHDAHTLPEQELQLLARLIQNFPGANIRAILLMVGQAPAHEKLSAFGRKILKWDIELPNDEQAQAALEVAKLQGQQEAMALLLRRLGKPRKPLTSWTDEEADAAVPVDTPEPPIPTPGPNEVKTPFWSRVKLPKLTLPKRLQRKPSEAASTDTPVPSLAQRLTALRQRSPVLAAGAGALALSVLMMMWLQPDAFGLKGKGRASAASATAAEPQAAASAPPALGAQTTVVSATAAPQAALPTDVPDPAAEAQAWLREMPPQSFVIQHGTMPTYEKAQQMLKSYASLRDARIVAAYRPGEKLAYFVVLSGPYERAGKAYERFGRKDLPNTSWVRTAQSLQQQLEPTAKETR